VVHSQFTPDNSDDHFVNDTYSGVVFIKVLRKAEYLELIVEPIKAQPPPLGGLEKSHIYRSEPRLLRLYYGGMSALHMTFRRHSECFALAHSGHKFLALNFAFVDI